MKYSLREYLESGGLMKPFLRALLSEGAPFSFTIGRFIHVEANPEFQFHVDLPIAHFQEAGYGVDYGAGNTDVVYYMDEPEFLDLDVPVRDELALRIMLAELENGNERTQF